jgi:hypothetical protein
MKGRLSLTAGQAQEDGVRVGAALLGDLASAVAACARWHDTPDVEVRRIVLAAWRRPLAARLQPARRRRGPVVSQAPRQA